MKGRFDILDVTAMVPHLHASYADRKLLNVYDGGDSNTYILKFDKTTIPEDSSRNDELSRGFILMESGTRVHPLVHYQSEASMMPSPFAAKLRKHLRGLRLSRIYQVGRDRVIVFSFGSAFHLILELYDRGNLILCDGNYLIMALLRSHIYNKKTTEDAHAPGALKDKTRDSGNEIAVQVGHVYPVSYATTKIESKSETFDPIGILSDECLEWALSQLHAFNQKEKKKQVLTLKSLFLQSSSGVSHYGPALLEHCILSAKHDPNEAILDESAIESISWSSLGSSILKVGQKIVEDIKKAEKGYIRYSETEKTINGSEQDDALTVRSKGRLFHEYFPYLFMQHSHALIQTYDSFGEAVQDFYQQLAVQKASHRQNQLERAAVDKLKKIREDQEARVLALNHEQEMLQSQAQVVQQNATNIDAALAVINSAINSGMDWDQLDQLIHVEQEKRNPIALLIHKLKLEKDVVVMKLPIVRNEDDSESLLIEVHLKESAHSNARILFTKYRAAKVKAAKTLDSMSLALKAAEENAKRQTNVARKRLKSNTAATAAAAGQRKPFWFEKFHWFISSDNYLALGGKDAHQNELLVKRYLRPGDAYLHADVFGSPSSILRAKRQRTSEGSIKTMPLSSQALREAGNFTICRSSAWTSRMVTSAWWVEANQVSKTAPTGEYLTVGSFMVRGKKNYLPPTPLEMGIAVLFRLGDDDSVARHKNDRRDFALISLMDNEVEESDAVMSPRFSSHNELKRIKSPDILNDASTPRKEDLIVDFTKPQMKAPAVPEKVVDTNDVEEIFSKSEEMTFLCICPDLDDNREVHAANQKKKGISTRDRKLIKKYGSLETAADMMHSSATEYPKEPHAMNSPVLSTESGSTKRGKKAKLKRMKQKYSGQDDIDREMVMLALQGGEKMKKKKNQVVPPNESQLKLASETTTLLSWDSSAVAEQLPAKVRALLADCIIVVEDEGTDRAIRWDKFDASTLDQLKALEPIEAQIAAVIRLKSLIKTEAKMVNLSSTLGGILRAIRKYGYERIIAGHDSSESEAIQAAKHENRMDSSEEFVVEGPTGSEGVDETVDDTIELNKLCGKPQLDDLLLYAIPVCSPYQTLLHYTYRVKLTPGGMKRGKAAKQCVEMLSKMDGLEASPLNERCIDFLTKINENDWVQAICPGVKISAPGASKAIKNQKSKRAS